MKVIFMIMATLLVYFGLSTNSAQASYECSLVKQLAERLSCGWAGYPMPPAPGMEAPKDRHFILSSDFGPSSCKVKKKTKSITKDLKNECEQWLKERRSDLGRSFVTGSCEAKIDKCKLQMEQVRVKGVVHYSRKQAE